MDQPAEEERGATHPIGLWMLENVTCTGYETIAPRPDRSDKPLVRFCYLRFSPVIIGSAQFAAAMEMTIIPPSHHRGAGQGLRRVLRTGEWTERT